MSRVQISATDHDSMEAEKRGSTEAVPRQVSETSFVFIVRRSHRHTRTRLNIRLSFLSANERGSNEFSDGWLAACGLIHYERIICKLCA